MADWRNGNHTGTARLDDFLHALRDLGIQPGDFIPIKAWSRAEYIAFGVVDPGYLRNYRRALLTLDVIEQVGGRGRGHPIEGYRIRTLPPGPLLPA